MRKRTAKPGEDDATGQAASQSRIVALEAENAHLRAALRAGRIGHLTVDPTTGDHSDYSAEYLDMHRLPPGTAGETKAEWMARVHPDDRARARQEMSDALANRSDDYRSEFRVLSEGETAGRWIAARGGMQPAHGVGGEPEHLAVAQHDVTERRNTEDALRESEAHYRWAADLSPQVPWMADAEGRILDFGRRWTVLTGMGRERTLAGEWVEAVHPDDLAGVQAAWAKSVRTGEPFDIEHRLRGADGSYRWIRARAMPRRDKAGRVMRWYGTTEDVHEYRAALEALRLGEARFRAAVDAVSGILWTNDASGKMTGAQPGWEALTGQTPEEYQGFGWAGVVHPDDAQPTIEAWNAAVAERRPFVFEHRLRCHDGAWRHFSIRAVPVTDDHGSIREWVGVHTDVTEQREAEEALRRSEAQFRAIADNIPQMAWMARPDRSRYWFNRRWYEYTGLAADQAEGFGWQAIHHPDHLDRVMEGMRRAWATAEAWEDTFPLRGKNGEYRWFLTRAVPVRDAGGQVTLWFGTNTDVTERQAIEAALREESHTLEVLNHTGAALAGELDHASIVQKVTDAATELSGAGFGAFFYNVVERDREAYTLYAISGVPREAFSRFPMPRNTAVFAPTFHGDGIIRSPDITADPRYGHNTPHRGMPEGHLPVRSYLAVPVVSRSGEVLGGLFFGHPAPGVFTERAERLVAGIAAQAAVAIDNARLYRAAQHEVAARKEAEAKLRRLNETLERLVEERTAALQVEVEERRRAEQAARQSEKLAALGQLTGGIAHDFNNIVQVVASGATLLRSPALPEERRAVVLEALAKSAQSAKELTGRLLAFARRQALRPEAFDLNERLRGMAEMLRHTLGSRMRIETDFRAGVWPVMADPGQFEVAVLNLAVNARDAMLPKGGTLTLSTRNVTLEATPERAAGDYVCLAVKDTGRGMPPAVLARVFEPFFTTKGQAGTGLGLPQVHGFAKQSGGDIAIESAPGRGTTILFHLPRAALMPDQARALPEASLGARLERTAGKTVLVVDDNPDVASFAASMLEELGYTTRRAMNASEALGIVAEDTAIDAVFSDVVMPGEMDGVQLANVLRLRHPHLGIVLATGYSQVLTEWNGKAVAEVLSKPYRLEDLASALEHALATPVRDTGTNETTGSLSSAVQFGDRGSR